MRYVTKSYWDDDNPLLIYNLNVDGPKYEETGLIDKDGNPICRLPRPIGFGRDNEW